MGAFAYCPKCSSGKPRQTIQEMIAGTSECSFCGYDDGRDEGLVGAVELLLERVEALESRVPVSSEDGY